MNRKYSNHLIHESSPYLLQHAHNPVNWYPWGPEALEKARREDKLILVSIGYAACHWCHVMEHESFEDEETAALMNRYFVCIKVDREERPDVDQLYMNAVQLLTGSGGWPLNCFALPDGRPVYGGTYFRKEQWKNILESIAIGWLNERERYLQTAARLEQGIKQSEEGQILADGKDTFDKAQMASRMKAAKAYYDEAYGGDRGAPKFPMPSWLQFQLEYAFYHKDEQVSKHLHFTLEQIARGGIYDHLGGGFARYSVDAAWKVPHFEKMLYDNAQLISLYSIAYKDKRRALYKERVYQSIDFIERELSTKEQGFYSSLDADSEGEEGRFYVWTYDEIEDLLGRDSSLFCDYYSISRKGNWEKGKNILYITAPVEALARAQNMTVARLDAIMTPLKQKLFDARQKRPKPATDDKILCAWNALMIKALTDAYRAFNEEKFLLRAQKAMHFLLENMMLKEGQLFRSYKNGRTKIKAFLDDYAFTIEALLALFKADNDAGWLSRAKTLTDHTIAHFFDDESELFYYSSNKHNELIINKKELYDNVIPSSNSAMAKNLYQVGLYYSKPEYLRLSENMAGKIYPLLYNNLRFFSNWASLIQELINPPFELVITGPEASKFKETLLQPYRPDIVEAATDKAVDIPIFQQRFKAGETLIYVCKNRVCHLATGEVETARKLLNANE